jgi:hypothetical protein
MVPHLPNFRHPQALRPSQPLVPRLKGRLRVFVVTLPTQKVLFRAPLLGARSRGQSRR